MKKAKTVKVTRIHDGEPTGIPPAPKMLVDDGKLPPPGPGEFKTVPREQVRPDPNQPRKVFDEAKLNELAESIRLNGILSPLVVQHRPAKLKIEEPNLIHDDWQAIDGNGAVVFSGQEGSVRMCAHGDVEDYYQIVFGERRWRAAGLAGLATVPVIVRELTEREVFVHQFVENQARENLSALEEAKAFQERIAREKETDPTFNAEKLAEALGVARATVYNRLTLTRLTQPVLDALTGGKIQTTVAGLIAMIPDPKQQEKLLAKITNEEDWQFPFSFRDVEELIEGEYCKQLKDAPFDLHDANLVAERRKLRVREEDPLDGELLYGGACATCPMRTGNMREDFPHIKNLNVCTKPDCYADKCRAHFAEEASAAERKGQKVLTQKEFKSVKKDYIEEGAYSNSSMYGYWKDLMGKHAPEPALVITDAGLKRVYPREAATEAAIKNGHKAAKETKPQTTEERAQENKKRQEAEARKVRRDAIVVELAPELSKCLGKLSDKLAWELAAEMIMSVEWPDPAIENMLIHNAKGAKARTLGKCFADGEWHPVNSDGDWSKENVAMWKRAGVDLIEEEKKRDKDAAPVLPLVKAKPQQKELLNVKKNKAKLSPAKKAHIAAAAKARWAKAKAKAAA